MHGLDKFSSGLMGSLERSIRIGDTGGVGTIWSCCVLCLAHLAALCHLMGQADPALGTPMNHLYNLTLDNLCNLSLESHIEECSSFDVLTGVRFSRWFAPPNEVRRLPKVIRCLGNSRWKPSKHAAYCTRTQRTGRWDIGKRSSKRRTPIFKRVSQASNRTRLLAW